MAKPERFVLGALLAVGVIGIIVLSCLVFVRYVANTPGRTFPSESARIILYGDKAAAELERRIATRLNYEGFTVVDNSERSMTFEGAFEGSNETIRLLLVQATEHHDPGALHSFTFIPIYSTVDRRTLMNRSDRGLESTLQMWMNEAKSELTTPYEPYDNE